MAKVKNKSTDGSAGESKKKKNRNQRRRKRERDPLQKAMSGLSLSRGPKIPTEHTQGEAQQGGNIQRETTGSLDAQKPPWRPLPDHLSHRIRNLPEDWRQSAFNPKPFQMVIRAITQAIHPDIELEYSALITLRDEVEDIVVRLMQKAAQAAERANRSEIRVEDMRGDNSNLTKTQDETKSDLPSTAEKSSDGDCLVPQASVKQDEVHPLDAPQSVEYEMSM
ncbi:hypothetical protein LTS15_003240 [Exophiala xenobiotica]|nr:hypothetical protein LTS15_003240 [Exophiala xenobiotica]